MILRGQRESDRNFILSSWKMSYRDTMGEVPSGHYFEIMKKRIDRIQRDGAGVLVACWEEDDDHILGWCVFGPCPGVVHYVYVRETERRRGVARELVRAALLRTKGSVVMATHWTPPMESVSQRNTGVFYAPSYLGAA